jgi:colicin import membrane protein
MLRAAGISGELMGRKLKTFQTSMGFFDLAIAAPSMKAALEAWGSGSNLFHQGFAKQVDDSEVVAATMAKPGIVLKRPVGSQEPFQEHAKLPEDISGSSEPRKRGKARTRKTRYSKIDDKTARKAAQAYEREQKKRDFERRKEVAEGERRDKAVAKAEAAIEAAKRDHEQRAHKIETERAAIEKRSEAEQSRWDKLKEKLDNVLHRARR